MVGKRSDASARKDYGITFMDVRMPVMNGVDSFFEIRKMKPTARIVLMTGFKEPIVNKALENGAVALLSKPLRCRGHVEARGDRALTTATRTAIFGQRPALQPAFTIFARPTLGSRW